MTYILTAKERSVSGSKASSALRAQDLVPAVAYGAALKDPVLLTVKAPEFLKVWQTAGETSIVTLDGLTTPLTVLVHDVTVDPLYGRPIHVDFLAVRTDQAVEVDVPLVFTGVAPAEKELGGTLIKVMHTMTIEALPKDLPHEIEVDISKLNTFDDQVLVKDVILPAGVATVLESDEVVALVQEVHEEAEPAVSTDVSAIEVEKKGKEETAAE